MSHESEQYYSNDLLSVTATHEVPSRVNFKIVLQPEWLQKRNEKAVQIVRKNVTLPGFRKGKAPADYVKAKFGGSILQEWRQLVIEEALWDALQLAKLSMVSPETAKHIKCEPKELKDPETAALIHYSFDCFPTVPLVKHEAVQWAPIPAKEVTQEAIAQEENRLKEWAIQLKRFQKMQEAAAEPKEESEAEKEETLDEKEFLDLFKLASIEEFHAKIKEQLEHKFNLERQEEEESALQQAIVEGNPFEVPKSLQERAAGQHLAIASHWHARTTFNAPWQTAKEKEEKKGAIRAALVLLARRFAEEEHWKPDDKEVRELFSTYFTFAKKETLSDEIEFCRSVDLMGYCYEDTLIDHLTEKMRKALTPQNSEGS